MVRRGCKRLRAAEEKAEERPTFSSNERWFIAKVGRDVFRHGVLPFLMPRGRTQFRAAWFQLVLRHQMQRKAVVFLGKLHFWDWQYEPGDDLTTVIRRRLADMITGTVSFAGAYDYFLPRYVDALFPGISSERLQRIQKRARIRRFNVRRYRKQREVRIKMKGKGIVGARHGGRRRIGGRRIV